MFRAKATVYTVSTQDEYLRVLEVMSNPVYWGSEVATPARIAAIPVATLPEISFDHQGWSPQIKGSNNVWFLIRRLGAGRFYITEVNGRTASPVMSFAGVLAAAATRVAGESANPATIDVVTDYDRRTNFGAF